MVLSVTPLLEEMGPDSKTAAQQALAVWQAELWHAAQRLRKKNDSASEARWMGTLAQLSSVIGGSVVVGARASEVLSERDDDGERDSEGGAYAEFVRQRLVELRDLRRKLSEHKRERSRSCLVREESCTDFSVRMKLAAPGARVGRRAACRMNVLHVINPMGQGVIEE
eukprot:CAMPEP_0182828312 /NCGR_PEP_ID=MMETSP0006_2-20121128/17404_1 /TAXON_ID=97485 /ORGANISM="Prymnesium parvum, Strain Texoma1" /LENGTH=167 /DNA_ID=CAMNT_0024955663 /DNA_START=17 /DNA_END=522 /DNA_ORIENTATION=+